MKIIFTCRKRFLVIWKSKTYIAPVAQLACEWRKILAEVRLPWSKIFHATLANSAPNWVGVGAGAELGNKNIKEKILMGCDIIEINLVCLVLIMWLWWWWLWLIVLLFLLVLFWVFLFVVVIVGPKNLTLEFGQNYFNNCWDVVVVYVDVFVIYFVLLLLLLFLLMLLLLIQKPSFRYLEIFLVVLVVAVCCCCHWCCFYGRCPEGIGRHNVKMSVILSFLLSCHIF